LGLLSIPLASAVSAAGIVVSCTLGIEDDEDEERPGQSLILEVKNGETAAYTGFFWGFVSCLSLLPSINWMVRAFLVYLKRLSAVWDIRQQPKQRSLDPSSVVKLFPVRCAVKLLLRYG